ncbi:AMP-binding protein [Mycolicibacterium elephantis]
MPTIGSTLRATAARVPERRALVYGSVEYTYGQLDAEVDRYAAVLAARGVTKGARVALLASNSDRFVVAFYAIHRLGAIFVPINPALAAPEIAHIARDCRATALLFEPALAEKSRTVLTEPLAGPLDCLALGDAEGFDDLVALARRYPADFADPEVHEGDDAQILYTSGTTGAPKGALFDHHRALWVAVSSVATCGMMDGDRLLHAAPLYHAAALCLMLIPGTLVGATHVVEGQFDAAAVANSLERERITMFFGVPTMYQFLLRTPHITERDMSSWRTGIFGAAPMPASTVEAIGATFPSLNLIQLCGQTEAGPSGIFSSGEQVRCRPDASGRHAMLGMQCKIVSEDGSDVAPGDAGELLLRGQTVMKGYWNNLGETARTIVDGWLHTGDVCRLDADGYMTLVDRLKDMIITGGRNVYCVEVEGVVAAHPDVLDVAVVGRPHADYGESIVAFVCVAAGSTLTLQELRDFAAPRLAKYKLPHELELVAEIPRNASGKIVKRSLA